jgi:hypothetical protein
VSDEGVPVGGTAPVATGRCPLAPCGVPATYLAPAAPATACAPGVPVAPGWGAAIGRGCCWAAVTGGVKVPRGRETSLFLGRGEAWEVGWPRGRIDTLIGVGCSKVGNLGPVVVVCGEVRGGQGDNEERKYSKMGR